MEEEPPAASKGAAVAERDGDVEAPAPAQRSNEMSPRPTGGPQDGAPAPAPAPEAPAALLYETPAVRGSRLPALPAIGNAAPAARTVYPE